MAASIALHLRDPHDPGSWGFCPWLALTGTYCPACGGLRAVNELTDRDVVAAASSNLLLVAATPVLVALWARWLVDRWRGVRRAPTGRGSAWLGVALLGAGVLFVVVRNLPFGAWLAP
jgi:hypothetical protein